MENTEIEIKLAIAPHDLARLRSHPRLAAASTGPSIIETIENRYFDTPRRLLARHGMALRLRRIGKRWWQTLKTADRNAGALSTRGEWETPLAGPAWKPDAWTATPLARLDAPQALARRLVPVFSTDFERERRVLEFDDGTRAEFAIDIGTIRCERAGRTRSAPICEIELELVHGSPSTLLRFARRIARDITLLPGLASKAERGHALAGGHRAAPIHMQMPAVSPEQPATQALADLLLAGQRSLLVNLQGLLEHPEEPEYVHQARVALRRMRSALRAHRPWMPRRQATRVAASLRPLATALGAVRDWDVMCASTLPRLARETRTRPSDSGFASIMHAAHERRERAHAALAETVRAPACGAVLIGVEILAERLRRRSSPSAAMLAAAVLDPLHARAVARARKADTLGRRGLHRLRIDIKRLRYAHDLYAPLFAQADKTWRVSLSDLQDRLGELNDLAVAARLLDRLGPRARTAGWRTCAKHLLTHGMSGLAKALESFARAVPPWRNGTAAS